MPGILRKDWLRRHAKGFWGFNTKGMGDQDLPAILPAIFEEGEARVIKDNKVMYIDHSGNGTASMK